MFDVGVAVNSKRTVYEARSKEIWPQNDPNFAIQESRLQAKGSHWSSGKSKDHARSLGPTKTRRHLLRKAFRKLAAHDISTIFFASCQKCGMKCQLLIEGELYDRHPQLEDFAMNRAPALMALLLSGIALMVSGCGNSVFPPPVDVSYRSSLFGIGKVVVITNTSGHHLYNVKVLGRNFKQVSSASVKATDHLAPGGVVAPFIYSLF